MLTVYVVSDATGDTAQRMVQAALAQFQDAPVRLVRRARVRTPQQVRAVVREARANEAIVFHTLVSDELRRLLRAEARTHAVDALDVMGPILERLATHLKLAPQEKPGLFQSLAEAKSREIEAVSFAFRHDDGQNTDGLDRAEVVLVGISRTKKTPTMLYLAYRGWFAANVPLVPSVPPPKALLDMPAERVFCLTMAPDELQRLRRTRAEEESIPLQPYASLDQIRTELSYMDGLCRRHGWQRVDVTAKSVEEASREIIEMLKEG
jgi:[pyruvate, water dikinase]-phosphate phosphotransferase / [pyruvate, water dikinase] kinase